MAKRDRDMPPPSRITVNFEPDLCMRRFAMQKGQVSRDTSPVRVYRVETVRILARESAQKSQSLKLSWRRDLNPRPSDYKSDALPTELRQPSGAGDGNRTRDQQLGRL